MICSRTTFDGGNDTYHNNITLANCFGINHLFGSRKESFSNDINIISTFLKYSPKQSLKESLLLHHKIIFK